MIRLEKLRDLDLVESAKGRGFLSAASDLILDGEYAYVVSDDEHFIGIFERKNSRPGREVRLFPGELPARPEARKRKKPDLEACVLLPELGRPATLLLVPSGSTSARQRGARIELGPRAGEFGVTATVDFGEAYGKLSESIPGLNFEGAAATDSELILFHRGNEEESRNAIVRFDRERALAGAKAGKLTGSSIRSIVEIDLGEFAGTRLSFTSAAFDPGGRLWFLAVAEGGGSSYHDGAFVGSVLGRLAPDLTSVDATYALEVGAKPEGLAFDPSDPGRFYVVTDADDPQSVAGLYSGRLE